MKLDTNKLKFSLKLLAMIFTTTSTKKPSIDWRQIGGEMTVANFVMTI